MSLPRKNRQSAVIYPTITTTDHRGNDVKSPNMDAPIPVTATFSPQSKPNVYDMLIDTLPEGVDAYSRVEWLGAQWDIVAPPAPHAGPRQTRHCVLEIHKR
jgi:hypothetical protein